MGRKRVAKLRVDVRAPDGGGAKRGEQAKNWRSSDGRGEHAYVGPTLLESACVFGCPRSFADNHLTAATAAQVGELRARCRRGASRQPGFPRGDNGAGDGALEPDGSMMASNHAVVGRMRCQIVRFGVR